MMIRAGHQLSKIKPFRDLEIMPPRKQLLLSHVGGDGGGDVEGSDLDPYSTDHFRLYEFKVRKCTRSRNHDWTDCPFLHRGEKARRRDPRRFHYCATICTDFRRGSCPRGDQCEFAHGVFECWLHPTRYRTEACKDGKNCKRKVCFFAHSPRELRILPEPSPITGSSKSGCCMFCRSAVTSSSPTSTLLGLSRFSRSPSLSPPKSSVKLRSKLERTTERKSDREYQELLVKKMMSSVEGMRLENEEWDWDSFGRVRDGKGKHEYGSGCVDPDIEWVNELLD